MPKLLEVWPLLLCGPILRRVTPTAVSVFVALKHERTVALTVFDGTTKVAEGTTSTISFGKYLHATVVTANPTSAVLTPNKIYTYDVTLTASGQADALDTDRSVKTLASPNLAGPGSLLAGSLALGYSPNVLPSFALPPATLNDLRLAHASCRKPHGMSRDALPILDTVIRESFTDPLKRPHQLFLTGDQIYADDVAEALLKELSATGKELLGWTTEEPLPPREANGTAPTESEITPGFRMLAVIPPLTSGEADCHLIRLGEFYAMYLFAWSDALWPETIDLRPSLPYPPAGPISIGEEQAITEYNNQVPHLRSFRSTLGKVRRMLANVPTYMIFDDHEITDDWFLHREQRDEILASPLGTRIVTNGLCAYTVFQAWGNDPDAFTPATAGGLLLSALSQWTGQDDSNYSTLLNSLGTTSTGAPPAIRFDYAVDGPAHDVIVLDSRTRRGYPAGDGKTHADLLALNEIQTQVVNRIPSLPANRKPLTVLVSPAPVFGHPLVEFGVGLVPSPLSTAADRETWLVESRRQVFERLLEALVPCGSVLILSGDVHHGFTVGIRYWDDRTLPGNRATFVQLVSSPLKNEGGWKMKLVLRGPAPIPGVFFGWLAPGKHVRERAATGAGTIYPLVDVEGSPAVRRVKDGDQILTPPGWRYRVVWASDNRTFVQRTGRPPLPAPSSTPWLERQRDLALEQRHTASDDQCRTVVTRNNISTLRFAATTGAVPRPMIMIEQSLWYRLSDDIDDGRPYTVHWADLSPSTADDPKPDAPGSTALPPANASSWADVVSFRPPTAVQTALKQRGFYVHRLEDAWGQRINLDRYPVRISVMPMVNGARMDAKGLLSYLRLHLKEFIDPKWSEFAPYDTQDGSVWDSSAPEGAVIEIQMRTAGMTVDKGSVVCAESTDDHWTFSTVWTHRDWSHPVSGNRQFGYVTDAGTYVFFTRGADRTTRIQYEMGDSMVFGAADNLWASLQKALEFFVNNHDGVAAAESRIWQRYLWLGTKAAYHKPTVDWIP